MFSCWFKEGVNVIKLTAETSRNSGFYTGGKIQRRSQFLKCLWTNGIQNHTIRGTRIRLKKRVRSGAAMFCSRGSTKRESRVMTG